MTEKEIIQKLAAICSQAEHCEYEMQEKMQRWEIDEETQAKVIAYLVKERYLDEERYCRAFVREKILYTKWGRKKIETALYQKHIDREVSRNVLNEIENQEYVDVLLPMLRQKERTIKAKNDYERNIKLFKWALGRGYTYEVIKECIDADVEEFD